MDMELANEVRLSRLVANVIGRLHHDAQLELRDLAQRAGSVDDMPTEVQVWLLDPSKIPVGSLRVEFDMKRGPVE